MKYIKEVIIGLLLIALAVIINQPKPQLPICKANEILVGGTITKRILINTAQDAPVIAGEVFLTGEWKHVDEQWFVNNAVDLAKYPDIKEAQTVLEEKLKIKIEEENLQSFAQGLKEASLEYNQELPAIADVILNIVPYEK